MRNQGITRLVPLKPSAVLKMHGQEIEMWYEIMLSKVRLKNFGVKIIKC